MATTTASKTTEEDVRKKANNTTVYSFDTETMQVTYVAHDPFYLFLSLSLSDKFCLCHCYIQIHISISNHHSCRQSQSNKDLSYLSILYYLSTVEYDTLLLIIYRTHHKIKVNRQQT